MSGMHDYEIDGSTTPDDMRGPPPTNIRGKEVCMLPQDWHDFGRAVAETWPQARYYAEPDYINDPDARQCGPVPPPIPLFSTLGEACSYPYRANRRGMVFDANWRPRFWKAESHREGGGWYWRLLPPPHPSVRFWPGGYIRDRPVPHPDTGSIDFYLTPKDKEHLALAARFFRLFGKFATNRKGLVHVRVPELTVTVPVDKGQPSWCGHRAIEWARQEPDRVLFYARAGFGLRPTGDVLPLKKPAAGKGS